MVRFRLDLALALALALMFTVGGCRKKDGDPTKVTVGSTDNATRPVVDENYRFELSWPGAGWKLMHQRDASRIVPDAVAGAIHTNNLFGVVIVEAAPGVSLEDYGDALIDQMPLEDKHLESRTNVTFAGTKAIRFVVTGLVDGVPFRYVELAFLHQGYGYQVLGWGTQSVLTAGGAQLQPLLDAFQLVPGKVSGRASGPVVTTASGVGWRVKDGVFESAVTRLRVTVKEPWRLLVGPTLEQSNKDAEVGISHADPELFVVVIAESAPAPAQRAPLLAQLRANLDGERGTPWTGTFAGEPVEFERITSTSAMAIEYLHGVHFAHGLMFQVLGWYTAGDRERASRIVQSGLDAFAWVPAPEAAALAAELERLPDTQSGVGLGHALRAGVYHGFTGGWRWTKPPTFWRISVGDKARAANADSELMLFDPARNLYGLVISEAHEGGKGYHDLVVDNMPGRKSPATQLQLAGERAYSSTIDTDGDNLALRYRLTTVSRAGRAFQLLFWATPGDMDTHTAVVDAAIRGFAFDPTPIVERRDGEYLDHRLGFALAMPPSSWRFADESPAETKAIQTFVSWKKGASGFTGVVALYASTTDETWFLDFIEQTVRDSIGNHAVGTAKRTEATLDGFPARRLQWPEFDVYVALRDGVLYAFMTTERTPGPASFRFLR